MQLTRYTDYALRVLIYLGLREGRPATIQEIAATYGISRNHLMKIVHQLAKEKIILTTPGKGGGLRLAQAPERIRIGDVVRRMESNMNIVECFVPAESDCPILPACRLKGVLLEAREGFLAVLDRHTLADLLRGRERLAQLLDAAPVTRRAFPG